MTDMTSDSRGEDPERVVVRDKRRIDPQTGQVRVGAGAAGPGAAAAGAFGVGSAAGAAAGAAAAAAQETGSSMGAAGAADADGLVEELRRELIEREQEIGERTEDLQRLQAQFVNYKRRTERDITAAGAAAAATVLADLLPLLDDIDRARAHGDLTGGFRAVAEGLERVGQRHGLEAFGEPGDPFDPTIHEAVTHALSPDVDQVECSAVLRRGYRVGERLLRAAMVAVVEPGEPDLVQPDESAR